LRTHIEIVAGLDDWYKNILKHSIIMRNALAKNQKLVKLGHTIAVLGKMRLS